jgi:hypothetical protein
MKSISTIGFGLILALSASCRERGGASNTANASDKTTIVADLALDTVMSAINDGLKSSVAERMEGKAAQNIANHTIREIHVVDQKVVSIYVEATTDVENIPYKCDMTLELLPSTMWKSNLASCSPNVTP